MEEQEWTSLSAWKAAYYRERVLSDSESTLFVYSLKRADARFLYIGNGEAWTQVQADSACEMEQSLILGGGSEIY